jgi:hypothetical protein
LRTRAEIRLDDISAYLIGSVMREPLDVGAQVDRNTQQGGALFSLAAAYAAH